MKHLLSRLTTWWETYRQRKKTPPPDLYVLVRLRPETNPLVHISALGYPVMAVLAFLTVCLSFLSVDLTFLIVFLRDSTSAPLSLWLGWFQGTYRGPLFFIASDSWQRLILWGQIAGAIELFFACAVGWMLMQAWRDIRGMVLRARMARSSEPTAVLGSQLVKLSTPAEFYSYVIDAPSLTSVLDRIQEVFPTARPLSEFLADITQEAIEDPTQTTLRLRVTITHLLEVTILDPHGKQATTTFKNDTWCALIAYLALQPHGQWVPQDTLLRDVYGSIESGKESLMRLQMRRIQEALAGLAREADLLPETAGIDEEENTLSLFAHDLKDPEHPWSLAPSCEVIIFPRMGSVDQTTQETEQEASSDHQHHFQTSAAVVEEYGNGFLAEHQPPYRTWRWARDPFIFYRDRVLHLLEEAFTRERSLLRSLAHDSEERTETLGRLALPRRWYALSALGLHAREPQAERALQQGLSLYLESGDLTGAEDLYQDYAGAQERRGELWEPQAEIADLWAKVAAQRQAALDAQKRQKRKRASSKA